MIKACDGQLENSAAHGAPWLNNKHVVIIEQYDVFIEYPYIHLLCVES